jgi:hypothetical protein
METQTVAPQSNMLARIGVAVVIGVVLLAALGGWSAYGTTILFTYAQEGLAWCL